MQIKEYSSEIDLLIPKKNSAPWLDLLYEPRQVAVALEVKKSGIYSKESRDKIKRDFDRLGKLGVQCAYFTFEEVENYCWKPTEEFLGFPCFTLAWHMKMGGPLLPTKEGEDWESFVIFLRNTMAAR